MNRFTLRSALVLAAILLLAGATTSFAQFTGGAVSVTAATTGVTPLLRSEGVTEAAGDVTLYTAAPTSGGAYNNAYANGGPAAATLTISLTYNGAIGNKSVGPVVTGAASCAGSCALANGTAIKAATTPGISVTPANFVGFGAGTTMSWVAAGNTLTITISVPSAITLTFPVVSTQFLTIHGVRVNATGFSAGGYVSTLVGAGSSTATYPFTVAFTFINPLPVGAVQAGLDKTNTPTRVLASGTGLATGSGTTSVITTATNFAVCNIYAIPSSTALSRFTSTYNPAGVVGVRIVEGYPGSFTTTLQETNKSDSEVNNGTNFKITFTNVPASMVVAYPQALYGRSAELTMLGTAGYATPWADGGMLTLVGGTGTDAGTYEYKAGGSTITVLYQTAYANTTTTPGRYYIPFVFYKSGTALADSGVSISVALTIAPTTIDTSSYVVRFVDSGITGTVTTVACATDILFPFVSNKAGFDAGIAVSNAGQDHLGTSTQTGTCALYFFDGTTSGKTPTYT